MKKNIFVLIFALMLSSCSTLNKELVERVDSIYPPKPCDMSLLFHSHKKGSPLPGFTKETIRDRRLVDIKIYNENARTVNRICGRMNGCDELTPFPVFISACAEVWLEKMKCNIYTSTNDKAVIEEEIRHCLGQY